MTEQLPLPEIPQLSGTETRLDWPPAVQEFLKVADAVSKLNAWVKSARRGSDWSSKYVVYWLKGLAIQQAQRLGLASHRRIAANVQCRDCGGSGKYEDRYGYTHDHCFACCNTGTARLEFIETMIADRLRWHTPLQKAWNYVPGYSSMEVEEVTDWQPNEGTGLELEADEAARLLNLVEGALAKGNKYPRGSLYDGGYSYGEADDFNSYTLWIGETSKDSCVLCGGTCERYSHGVAFGRLQWSANACSDCRQKFSNGGIWPELKRRIPQELLNQPNVREWARRHKSAKMRSYDLVPGVTYWTPFDPGGPVELVEVRGEINASLFSESEKRSVVLVRFLTNHPMGYGAGTTGQYLADELRYVHEREN